MIRNNNPSNNKREITLFKILHQNCFDNILMMSEKGAELSLMITTASLTLARNEVNKKENNTDTTIRLKRNHVNQRTYQDGLTADINRINRKDIKNSLHGKLTRSTGKKKMIMHGGDDCGQKGKKSTFLNIQWNLNFKSVYYAKN